MPLETYQREGLEGLRQTLFRASSVKGVTVLAYYFRTSDRLDADFWRTEFAFLKTFETQGRLPSVLVVNETSPKINAFCRKHGIRLQIERNLIPGRIKTLAIDLVENLHSRFETDYVLIIQDDGFPLRDGIGEFVGKYDYIGAPWVGHVTYYDLYPYRYCVGNGGFSLRSKRICRAASAYYRRYFKWLPYWWYLLGDDTFYCKTLRFLFPAYRNGFTWASPEMASRFSIEKNCEFLFRGITPLGFHSASGFCSWQTLIAH